MDKLKELVAQVTKQITDHGPNQWTEEQLAALFPSDFYEEIDTEVQNLVTTEKQGLLKKNEQLLGEKKVLQKKLADTTSVNVEEYEGTIEKLKQKLEEQAVETQKQQKTYESQSSALQKELKKMEGAYTGEKTRVNTLLCSQALSTGLSKLKVKPEFMPALQAYLEKKVTLVEDPSVPEGRKAVCIVPGEDGKMVQKTFEEYLEKDWAPNEGKAYIINAATGGAGANDDSAGGHKQTDTEGPENLFSDLHFADSSSE